ncbi:hypothetical protein ACOKM3_14120 [Streptomyces sp. BH106]|uniref:hypothetical protein n=1 Tax=Streptomyces sp. BH106 TaxID=3410409 RepID=UPI003CEA07BC
MKDRTTKARRIVRDRTRTHRAAARIRRRGVASMATHAVAAGLPIREARTVASSLRRNAAKAACDGMPGVSYAGKAKARACTRYSRAEVARAAALYKPRKPRYAEARNALVGAHRNHAIGLAA